QPAEVGPIADARGQTDARELAGIAQGDIPHVVLAPRRRGLEARYVRRGVVDDVAAAQRRAVDRTATQNGVPRGGRASDTGQAETALPVADVDVGDHARAAEVDAGDAGGGGVGAAHGDAAELLVVEIPVGQRYDDRGVTRLPTVIVNLVDLMGTGTLVEADLDKEAGRQVGIDLGVA